MAYKYRENVIAKLFIRPFYRMIKKKKEEERRRLYLLNSLELLSHLKSALDSNNIFFWLEFGTLLGAYRDHDFIKHDFDLDIGVFFEDAGKICQVLAKEGFNLLHEFVVKPNGELGFEQTFIYKGVTVDLFYFHESGNEIYCNSFSPFTDEFEDMFVYQVKKLSFPYAGFCKTSFKGLEFNIPSNTESHLKAHYGEDFMIPNPSFNGLKEAKNIVWYTRNERVANFTSWL